LKELFEVGFIKGVVKFQEVVDRDINENDENYTLPEIRRGNLDWIDNYSEEELSKLQM
jgi:hypothetical protein